MHIPRKGIFQDLDSDGLRDRELRQLQHDRIDVDASCQSFELIASMEVDMLPGYWRHVPEDVARLSPLIHQHINFQGRYSFALSETVARGGLRPLRDPHEQDE